MSSLIEQLRTALAREYEVERELGAGSMGRVFLARDVLLDRPVAIKVIRPELATATAVERFQREARVLARIDHPNIVTVHRATSRLQPRGQRLAAQVLHHEVEQTGRCINARLMAARCLGPGAFHLRSHERAARAG